MLGEWEGAAGEGEVVIGAEQSDQAEDQATEGLEEARAIQAGPGGVAAEKSLADAPAGRCPLGEGQ